MVDLSQYGYGGREGDLPGGLIPARVVSQRRDMYEVVCRHGMAAAGLSGALAHRAKEKRELPAVGDFVALEYGDGGSSRIRGVLPRRTLFSRSDFSGHAAGYVKTVVEQVVAANFDWVFILTSLNQDLSVGRVARYLTLARVSGAGAAVILTKADLCENWDEQFRVVRALAHDVVVMRRGRVVEAGPADAVFADPKEPYTRALMAAAFDLRADDSGIVAT